MIYDCFQFFNELDILKLRMQILDPYVDRFVISEATTTFSGLPKPLYYSDNREMFEPYNHKVIHVTVSDTPEGGTHERDTFQKNAVGRGLSECRDEDIIIYSDLDEIPNPEMIEAILKDFKDDKIYHFAQRQFYCYLNMEQVSGSLLSYSGEFDEFFDENKIPDESLIAGKAFNRVLPVKKKWIGSKMCSYKLIREQGLKLGELRFPERKEIGIRVENGGWHFGYMGGKGEADVKKRVTGKVISAAHDEYNNEKVLSKVEDNIKDGVDLFGREAGFKRVEIDASFPAALREHINEYEHLIMPEEKTYIKRIRHIRRKLGDFWDKSLLILKRSIKKIIKR